MRSFGSDRQSTMSTSNNLLVVCLPRHLGDAVMAIPAMRTLAESGCDLRLYGRSERVARIVSMLTGVEVVSKESSAEHLFVPWPISSKWFAELNLTFPHAKLHYYDDECQSEHGRFSSNAADLPFIEHPRGQVEVNLLAACRLLDRTYDKDVFDTATKQPIVSLSGIDTQTELPKGVPDSYVVFSPGTSTLVRRWPLQYYAQLSDLIREQFDIPTILFGHVSERPLVERINALANAPLLDGLEFGIEDQLRVLARAKAVVTNDTGGAHLSSILGTPTIVIFGPTAEVLTGALGCIAVRSQETVFENSCRPYPCGAKTLCPHNRRHSLPVVGNLYPLVHRVRSLFNSDPAATKHAPTFREQYFAACITSVTPEEVFDIVRQQL